MQGVGKEGVGSIGVSSSMGVSVLRFTMWSGGRGRVHLPFLLLLYKVNSLGQGTKHTQQLLCGVSHTHWSQLAVKEE